MNSDSLAQFDPPPKVLTIAGSDSGGAAGLQADLRTFSLLGVYGLSVITAITAQNSKEVSALHYTPLELVEAQIEAVFSDYGAAVVKTGFIGHPEIISTIADGLSRFKPGRVVIDPVLVDHLGQPMFPAEVADRYVNYLFPLADLITPNLQEAQLIAGQPIGTLADIENTAAVIQSMGPRNVLIKSGRQENFAVDVLFHQGDYHFFKSEWLDTNNTHGSGDTLSAAICAYMAHGLGIVEAASKAHRFTHQAIETAKSWKLGAGHGPVFPGLIEPKPLVSS